MNQVPENVRRIRDLLGHGLTRHELRQPHWRHPYHGIARVAGEDETHPLTRVLDTVPLLPSCGCLGGWASLYLRGVAYIDGVDHRGNERPVLLHVCDRHRIRRRAGIEPTRALLLPGEAALVGGTPATVIARATYDEMCRAHGITEAVIVLDMSISRLAGGSRTTLASVRRLVERHRKTRGIRVARAALDLACDRSCSPWETRTRLVVLLELPIPNSQSIDRYSAHVANYSAFPICSIPRPALWWRPTVPRIGAWDSGPAITAETNSSSRTV
jgi:hypothetical protein